MAKVAFKLRALDKVTQLTIKALVLAAAGVIQVIVLLFPLKLTPVQDAPPIVTRGAVAISVNRLIVRISLPAIFS